MRASLRFGLSFAVGAFASAIAGAGVVYLGADHAHAPLWPPDSVTAALGAPLAISFSAAVTSGAGAATSRGTSRVSALTAAAGGVLYAATFALLHELPLTREHTSLGLGLLYGWILGGPFIIGNVLPRAFAHRGDV